MIDERKNLFRRILFTCVVGVTAAKLSHFENPIVISFFSFIVIMAMREYKAKLFLEKIGALVLGLFLGVIATVFLYPYPFLETLLVYAIFLTALKLFTYKHRANNIFFFVFTFMYTSISSNYNNDFDTQVLQFFWQMIWVFIIVRLAFLLFPTNNTHKEVEKLETSTVSNGKVIFFSLVLTIVWEFSMMFEWRFAFFAYVALISLFQNFELETMKKTAYQNIWINFSACSIAALFSLLLDGMITNIALMALGLMIIFIPFVYIGVYTDNPKKASISFSMIGGLIFPLTIYTNTSGVAVHDSFIRSLMITFLMGVILFIINLFPNEKVKIT